MSIDPVEKRRLARAAQERLRAQRRRAGLLRSRVIAASLICFALLWGAIFVQMATGNDPVLGRSAAGAAGAIKEGSRAEEERRQAGSSEQTFNGEEPVEELPPEEVAPEPEYEVVEEVAPEPEPVITAQS